MIAPNEDLPVVSTKKDKPATEPTVEKIGTFEPGQKVKHANGSTFEVRYQTPEGVALLGVGNLVHPSALKPL
jgi:hypothetical protein